MFINLLCLCLIIQHSLYINDKTNFSYVSNQLYLIQLAKTSNVYYILIVFRIVSYYILYTSNKLWRHTRTQLRIDELAVYRFWQRKGSLYVIDPRLTYRLYIIDIQFVRLSTIKSPSRPAIIVCRSGAIRDRNNSDKPWRKIRHFRRAIYGGIVSPDYRTSNDSIESSCTTRQTRVRMKNWWCER